MTTTRAATPDTPNTPDIPATPVTPAASSAPIASAAPATSAAPAASVRRLRPGAAVTVLRDGLHLRGRRGSVTLEGSKALPALWRLLEEPLRDGGLERLLDGMEADSAVRRAVDTLLARLDEHDLLVTGPAELAGPTEFPESADGAGPVARWLEATGEDPAGAAAVLAAVRAEVVAGAPDGPLARAAGRALAAGGLPVSYTADPALPEGRVLLYARGAGPERGIAAGLCGGHGYATAPGSAAQIRSDAAALEPRLTPVPAASAAPPRLLATLVAGAAAHRLLCAAAGLPDPADEGEDGRLLPGLPAVLLADARPPRAEYRSWLGPERIDADRRSGLEPAGTLAEALRRVTVLGDRRCGVLPEPLPGNLPQLPVALAACTTPAAGAADGPPDPADGPPDPADGPPDPADGPPDPAGPVSGAPRLDLARLEVFCRAAELRLGGAGFTVGADPGHARGRALRAAAADRLGRSTGRTQEAPGEWGAHPQARHWWTTLTVRLGVSARLEVFRAAPGAEAYHAVVHGSGPSARPVLGEAVEATPGDAAAFAALAAVTALCVQEAGLPADSPPPSGGAVAPLAAAGVRTAAWEDPGWTGGWLADLAGREAAFQAALRRLTGAGRPGAARRPEPPLPPAARQLADRLRAFGFTVLHTPEEER
ncbi:hypothetical protein [Streptomyces sp. NPDC090445]|uniref:hypothetical protein n=1 Tax=Streptomyces sp. NPDC090445 TaxID=3365963 RepID=UPI003821791C